ncbi:MAG: autotransporter-associated beta strand repeat-containing protein [Pirellulales bacterium]|nr:autotransporter-associated beta strand repeat-containing protein [Pirellulales bacterium]
MSFFSSEKRAWLAASLLGLFAIGILCGGASAATWTWKDQAQNTSLWTVDGQWTTSGAPNFTGYIDDLVFGASSNTTVYMNAVGEQAKSCTFDAAAPAYLFTRSPIDANRVYFSSTVATDVVWANNSTNTQTYESAIYFPGGTVNLGSGSGVSLRTLNSVTSSGGSFIYFGLGGTSTSTNTVTITGTRTVEITGDMKGNYGQTTINTNTDITIDGRWTWSSNANVNSTAMIKAGPGTITFNGNTYGADSTLCTKSMNINEGAIRIRGNNALGQGATGSINMSSTDWTGRLELANNISLTAANSRALNLRGRSNANAATHILNYSDNNSLGGTVTLGSGSDLNYNIGSNSGSTLTITSTLNQNNTGYGILNFSGAGDIAVSGNITTGGAGKNIAIRKYDAGILTLSGAANTFNGPLVVKAGTVAVTAASAIDSASAYHVAGGTLDVSVIFGGYAPASGKTLSGSGAIAGDITLNAGSNLAPGNSDSLVGGASGSYTITNTAGTLSLSNNLAVNYGGTLQYDLANVTTVGSGVNDLLSVGGNLTLNTGSTINVSLLNTALVPGTYRLINYTGSYSHDYGSIVGAVNLTGLSGGLTRQTYELKDNTPNQINLSISGAPLSLTWSGNGTNNNWDIVTTQDWNAGTQKFYNGDFVAFNDSGSNSPAVNLVGDLDPGSITVNNTTKDYTFAGAGAIIGASGLTKEGAGKLTIANSGTNTFSGAVNLNAGTLAFNQSADATAANALSGAGSLRQEGTNVLTLAGNNAAFTGTVTVAAGTLKVTNAAALGDTVAGTTVAAGATLDLYGLSVGAEPITVQGTGVGGLGAIINTETATSNVAAGAESIILAGDVAFGGPGTPDREFGRLSFSGSFQGNNKQLTKVGTNSVQINNTGETNLAEIFVNEGNLIFINSATMGDPTKSVTVANNAILSVYQSSGTTPTHAKPITIDATGGQFANWTGTNQLSSTFTLNGNLALLTGAGSLTLNGALTGAGNLTRDYTTTGTSGTIYLTSDNNNYMGTTSINAGTLSVGNGGTTGSLGGTGDITLGATGTLIVNRQGTTNLPRNIIGAGVAANAVQYGVAGDLNMRNAVFNVSGANTYSGQTNVNAGTVVLSTDTGLGDTAGKTVILGGSTNFGTVALTNNITVAENFDIGPRSATGLIANAYVPHIASLSGSNTLSGIILAPTMSGGSVYTISSLGAAPGDLLTISGLVASNVISSRSLWLRGGKGLVSGVIGNDGIVGVSGNWSSVSIADGGVWTFTNANNYTCGTYINAGSKLILSGSGSIAASTVIDLADSTATLDLTPLAVPTLTLGGTQSLVGNGTIQGNVTTTVWSNILSPSTAKVTDYNPVYGTSPRVETFNQLGGTMSITGDLTLGYGSESLIFKLKSSTTDPKNDKIAVGGALNLTGFSLSNVSIIPDTVLTAGSTYTLLTSTGAWNNTGSGGFQWDSFNNKTRYTFTLDTTTVPKSLLATVGGSNATLTWTGAAGAVWDVMLSVNWTGDPSDNRFFQGDAVIFDDSSSVNTVTVGDTSNPLIAPASITVNNDASHNYTFSGSGSITGGTGITKLGAGTLTLGTGNSFNGVVSITGGTVKLGSTSALGSNEVGTEISGGGTLDLTGYYNLRREPVSVAGSGDGGNGALVNNAADKSSGVAPYLYYVTLTGNATLGGSNNWSIEGPTLPSSGWAPGYLHGNNHALTKVGGNYLTLNDLGETNLGDIYITGGRLYLKGNTTLGNGSPSRVYLSNGAFLYFSDTTVTHSKPVTVDATGGRIHTGSGTATMTSDILNNADSTHTFIASASAGLTMTLNGVISGPGSLTKTTSGKVVLGGNNTYQGPTTIAAGDGTLELSSTGQISTLSVITNDSVFQVNGGAHTLGTIGGAGTMNVLAGSDVTATSITQGALNIGGSAAASAAAVPEPGTWLLLCVGLLVAAGLRRFRNR